MAKILVNVAWPYANGPIHLGHVAGSLLPADIFSRYNRLLGNEVLMVGGSDQHGTPITVSAEKEGVTPEELADRYHNLTDAAIKGMGIRYDEYNKTHSPVHFEVTQTVFRKLLENGYIYERNEEEYYCPTCRKYLPDRYVEGVCPVCGAEQVRSDQCDSCGKTFETGEILNPYCTRCHGTPEVRSSPQFALKLSAFEKPLLDYLSDKTRWRSNTRAFTKNFLEGGLRDRAITRDMSWGVPIPVEGGDWDEKVIYVWFDAVIGYLSSTVKYCRDHGDPEGWRNWWQNPDAKHYYFIGKDNIPFHTVIWPAILMGMKDGMTLPYDVPANEYLMFNGGKLSKSRKGSSDTPESKIPRDIPSVLRNFDPDEVRYYLSMVMPDTHDSDFSWEDMEQKVNSELVAALGNFYHRVLSFTFKNFGAIPANPQPSSAVTEAIEKALAEYKSLLGSCDFKKGIQCVMGLAHFANEYFNSCAPWKLVKEDKPACGCVLNDNLRLAKALAVMAWPFMPSSSEKVWGYFGLPGTIEEAGLDSVLAPLPAGLRMNESIPVYGKIDLRVTFPDLFGQPEADAVKEVSEKKRQIEAGNAAKQESQGPFSAFRKIDLRVGRAVEVVNHPDAEKLFVVTVDMGEGKTRTICTGLRDFYTADEIRGRNLIVVSNLAPRPLRGIDSCGMLLSAEDEEGHVRLLKPTGDVPAGTRIDCGLEGCTSDTIDYKKHFSKVNMEVSRVESGVFLSRSVRVDCPCDGRFAAVVDGDAVLPMSDGKGCYVTVDDLPLADGAGVR